jgi:predicted amidohydrolase YtcJ
MGVAFEANATLEEIKSAVTKWMKDNKVKKGDWVEGGKWGLPFDKINASMLDDIAPDNPVFLHDWTNHLGWVNTAALKAAEVTKDTPDPPSGVIDRDASGNPTGVLHDKALAVIVGKMPPPSEELLEKRAIWIFEKLNTFGITSIATAQLDPGRLKAYRALESQGKLTVRIKGHWDFNTRYAQKSLEGMAALFDSREKRGPVTPLIDPDGVKIYTDGVPNGHGVPMLAPYIDEVTYGEQSIDEPTLMTWVTRFDAMGLQVMTHAIGDMSNRHMINAVEAARKANGKGPRHHLAHGFYIDPADVPRIAGLDLAVELSTYHGWIPTGAGAEWTNTLLGRERVEQTVGVINSLLKAGAIVAWGSDWENIPEPDPWFAMEGMITRRHPGKPEMGRLNPNERIDRESAIAVFTLNGAILNEAEKVTGSIEVGKSADFIVINQNILEVPVENIHKTKVLKTVLQGKTVYEHK